MNKIKAISVALLILIIPTIISSIAEGNYNNQNSFNNLNYYDKGFRYNIQGWTYIHIEGEPYERGYQYGYLGYAEILDAIQRWANFGHSVDFGKVFEIINLHKSYEELSEKWWNICRTKSKNIFLKQIPKEYIQEMKGIADGIKSRGGQIFGREIEFQDILAAQFVQEIKYSYYQYPHKKFHPFRGFFNGLRDILTGKLEEEHPGHCSAFIATGDATSNGEIVIAHSTVFNRLLAERCNFIVDVQPSEGYRFTMTCLPGSISSQEDYYQNEAGIVLTETELPQGPYNLRGIPKGIRSRRAIQYSDSIDDVIDYLNEGNNGLIPNEWLIGDIKTEEIASFEQALFNTPVKRTFNGFFYSCNVPHNEKVKRELFGILSFIPSLSKKYSNMYAYGRDNKFKEQEKQYYGKIDTEIAKQILATIPICSSTTDGKISDSTLIKNMGLLAFMGIPDGRLFIPTDEQKKNFRGITDLPASGWVEFYSSISKPTGLQTNKDINDLKKTPIVLWEKKIGESELTDSYSNVILEDIIYISNSSGEIYALDANSGVTIWNKKIGDKVINHDISKDLIVTSTDKGVCAINKDTQAVKWYQYVGETYSKPIIDKNLVITSCSDADLYAFDIESGDIKWNYELPYSGVISDIKRDTTCVGSGNICYCINIKNGNTQWEFKTDGKITAAPRIDGKNVYLGSWDGNVYAVDTTKGNVKWIFETGWGIDTTPAVSDDIVFVGSMDNKFYAIDKDNGELKWFFTCLAGIHSSPVIYGEYVFFGSDDGRLYALNKETGDLEWNFAPGFTIKEDDVNNFITTPILSDPLVKDGIVYINVKGTVYALDAQTFEQPESVQRESDDKNPMFVLFSLLALLGIALILIPFLRKNEN